MVIPERGHSFIYRRRGCNVSRLSFGILPSCSRASSIFPKLRHGSLARLPSWIFVPFLHPLNSTLPSLVHSAGHSANSAPSDLTTPASPCGICRQVLREFCALETPVLLVPADYPQKGDAEKKPGYGEGGVRETTLGELLPDSFGPEHLGKPLPKPGKQ